MSSRGLLLLALVAVAGVQPASVAAPAAASAYQEVVVRDGGTLSGTVRFSGTPPDLSPLPVNKNRDHCGASKPSEALVLGPDLGVRGSVVWLAGVAQGKKAEDEVLIDNAQCLFVPHVVAVALGQRVQIRNSDPMLHNTHGLLGRPTVFNIAMPIQGQVIDVTRRVRKPGIVRILCDAHPHMFAWLVVHDSPYVAVTDERGAYRIGGIPPGTYRVTMWHEGFRVAGADKDGRPEYAPLPPVTRSVTIAPNGAATADFLLE